MIFKKVNDYIDNLKYEYIISETGLLFKRLYPNKQGSISEGYVVHHKDHNKLNNTPNNLILMRQDEHVSYHDTFRERGYHGRLV